MLIVHRRSRIVAAACVAIAIAILCWFHLSKSQPSTNEISIAEDEVYEAVVRDMITPAHGQPGISQLVFDDRVLTEFRPGADTGSCKEIARKDLSLENAKLPYDSLADRVYRVFARSAYDDSLRTDTIQDFLEKSCTVGPLSHTFHTDLPRTFVAAESVHFKDWPVEENGKPPFEQAVFWGQWDYLVFACRLRFRAT